MWNQFNTADYEGMIAETVTIKGHHVDQTNAYSARPIVSGPYPIILLIHHPPGCDELYRQFARRFALQGSVVLCPAPLPRPGHPPLRRPSAPPAPLRSWAPLTGPRSARTPGPRAPTTCSSTIPRADATRCTTAIISPPANRRPGYQAGGARRPRGVR